MYIVDLNSLENMTYTPIIELEYIYDLSSPHNLNHHKNNNHKNNKHHLHERYHEHTYLTKIQHETYPYIYNRLSNCTNVNTCINLHNCLVCSDIISVIGLFFMAFLFCVGCNKSKRKIKIAPMVIKNPRITEIIDAEKLENV